MTGSWLDTALDLSVPGGYTRPRAGFAAADGFARSGFSIWLAVRTRDRGADD